MIKTLLGLILSSGAVSAKRLARRIVGAEVKAVAVGFLASVQVLLLAGRKPRLRLGV
jgi:hypothetical protein